MTLRDHCSLMSETQFPVAGVLLAAGAGRRYGSPKVLVDEFLTAALTALRDGGCDDVILALGAAQVAPPAGVVAVTAPDWETCVGLRAPPGGRRPRASSRCLRLTGRPA